MIEHITSPNQTEKVKNQQIENSQNIPGQPDGGVTVRSVLLSLALAVLFGYIIPIIDVRFANTFLGAAHLPPGAVAVLLAIVLLINPLSTLASRNTGKSVLFLGMAVLCGVLSVLIFLSSHNVTFWSCLLGAMALFFLAGFVLGRKPLTRNETLVVYITCLFSCLVPGHGAENFFVSNIIGPFYFSNVENKWLTFLNSNLPSWFTPALAGGAYDPQKPTAGYEAVQGWYQGTQGIVPWAVWLGPLLFWSTLVLSSYVLLGCMSVILRAQWAEREALAFPLLRLPLEMTEPNHERAGMPGPLFCNKLFWIGAGIAICIQLANGLNIYFPDIPKIPLSIDGNFFSETPWNQIGWTPFQVLPIVVGITYLLTSEVSFSLWSFYWLIKFQLIAAYYLGFAPATLPNAIGSTAGAKAFVGYQQIGCYFAYVLILCWTAREHLWHVTKRAFGQAHKTKEEGQEAMSYPAAFWGAVLSFCFLIGWSVFAGINPLFALALWLTYVVIAIALTRIVAEAGLLFVQQGWLPIGTFAQITGTGPGTWLSAQTLVPATIVQGGIMTDLRGFIMPSFLQSLKLAKERGLKARALLALIATVILITYIMGVWMNVRLGYTYGGLTLETWFAKSGALKPAADATSLMGNLRDVSVFNLCWLALGMVITYGMMLARSRVLWFPFHPVGLLMSITYPMNRLWFSIFIGWTCKVLITRMGGSDTYRKTTPLFLGVALGDVAMMILWLIIDAWQGQMKHQLMPG